MTSGRASCPEECAPAPTSMYATHQKQSSAALEANTTPADYHKGDSVCETPCQQKSQRGSVSQAWSKKVLAIAAKKVTTKMLLRLNCSKLSAFGAHDIPRESPRRYAISRFAAA